MNPAKKKMSKINAYSGRSSRNSGLFARESKTGSSARDSLSRLKREYNARRQSVAIPQLELPKKRVDKLKMKFAISKIS